MSKTRDELQAILPVMSVSPEQQTTGGWTHWARRTECTRRRCRRRRRCSTARSDGTDRRARCTSAVHWCFHRRRSRGSSSRHRTRNQRWSNNTQEPTIGRRGRRRYTGHCSGSRRPACSIRTLRRSHPGRSWRSRRTPADRSSRDLPSSRRCRSCGRSRFRRRRCRAGRRNRRISCRRRRSRPRRRGSRRRRRTGRRSARLPCRSAPARNTPHRSTPHQSRKNRCHSRGHRRRRRRSRWCPRRNRRHRSRCPRSSRHSSRRRRPRRRTSGRRSRRDRRVLHPDTNNWQRGRWGR